MVNEVEDVKIDFSKFCKLAKGYKSNMKITGDYILMPKMDGVRLVTEINPLDWQVNLYSRNGKDKSFLLKKLRDIIRNRMIEEEFPNVILDGELLIYDENDKLLPMRKVQTIFGMKNEYNENLDISKLEYNIFDCYFPRYPDMKFSVRLTALEDIIKKIDNPQYKMIPYDILQAPFNVNNLIIGDGDEGLMLMSDVPYPVNKRNNSTLKIKKPRKQLTAMITGCYEGTGKNVGINSKFDISINYQGELTKISKVGSGLTNDDLVALNKNDPIGLIVDVDYDFSQGSSLRFPTVNTLRYDLGEEDITSINDFSELNKLRM
jgi:ATP-dependent DNA ligase